MHPLLPVAEMRRAVLGALVNTPAERLPEDEAKLVSLIDGHDKLALEAIATSLREAETAVVAHLDGALCTTSGQLKTLLAKPVSAAGVTKPPRAKKIALVQV